MLFFILIFYKRNTAIEEAKKVMSGNEDYDYCDFNIDRERLYFSSMNYLAKVKPGNFGNLDMNVTFGDEPGIDAGGPSKEWMSLLVKEVFDPINGLFVASTNKITV